MYVSGMELLTAMTAIVMIIIMILYFFAFYNIILKRDSQRRFLQRFHNAVFNIHYRQRKSGSSNASPTYWLEQLNLNYEKLCQSMPNNNYSSILDLLETIIYYYDSYPDRLFKEIFKQQKDRELRDFMAELCLHIKSQNPFISVPRKEADLMQSILDALNNNNKSLGVNSLKQLSQEIASKEKIIVKKDKENQRANIVSIVGIILTIFFGLLSFFPIWPKY